MTTTTPTTEKSEAWARALINVGSGLYLLTGIVAAVVVGVATCAGHALLIATGVVIGAAVAVVLPLTRLGWRADGLAAAARRAERFGGWALQVAGFVAAFSLLIFLEHPDGTADWFLAYLPVVGLVGGGLMCVLARYVLGDFD